MDINNKKELEVESLNLARRIAMFNGEAIYFNQNKLMLMDALKENELKEKHEKLTTIIKNNYPYTNTELILANWNDNFNHAVTLYEINLIKETLIEGLIKPEGWHDTLSGDFK